MPRPTALPVAFSSIPSDLRGVQRWVLWRHTWSKGRWSKLPFTIHGKCASSTDPTTWATFEACWDTTILDSSYDGVGIVIDGTDFQGIDLDDCRDPSTGALSDLAQEVLARVQGYAEVSPSGTGIKLFSVTNLKGSTANNNKGIELYDSGRYFTVTGHALTGHECLPVLEQDVGWLVELAGNNIGPAPEKFQGTDAEMALANYRAPIDGWGLQRVVDEVLKHLDPDMSYPEWIKVGQILHHQGESGVEWLEAWDNWSAESKLGKYLVGSCADKWRTFGALGSKNKGVATLASLLQQTKVPRDVDHQLSIRQAMVSAKAQIESCTDDLLLRGSVADSIRNEATLDKNQREILVAVWNAQHKNLTGSKLQMKDVRELLGVNGRVAHNQSSEDMPPWAKPWVYVTDVDKFFNVETKQEVSPRGFKSMYNRFMPLNFFGQREQADLWATERWNLPTVSHKAYVPAAGSIFSMFGKLWANLYRKDSVPEMPDALSADHRAAIDLVKKHFEIYFTDPRERELVVSWLAHNVQNPGVKIRWSPYIHGPPGDGKSYFGEFLGLCMGGQNVRSLNGSTLESNFTDWAMGYATTVVEEMKQHGHNRYDVMNRVKPYITNSSVEIHPKGKASYVAPNNTNYLFLSNYLDGAPVEHEDRRFMFLSSALALKTVKELTEQGYFISLFSAIQNNAGAIRSWVLTLPMHPEFFADGRAPHTTTKDTVVEMSKSELDVLLEELIEQGAVGVHQRAISSAHLTRALKVKTDEPFKTSRVNRMLTLKGFRFLTRRWWSGQGCRIWAVHGETITADQAIEILNSTQGADFLAHEGG